MKKMILVAALTLSAAAAQAYDCSEMIQLYYDSKRIHVQKISLESETPNLATYYVRANEQGGDLMDEVRVNPQTCDILSVVNVWAE